MPRNLKVSFLTTIGPIDLWASNVEDCKITFGIASEVFVDIKVFKLVINIA